MEWEYTRAENGNIALTGEIDLAACNGEFVLALGFGSIWTEAGQHARSTLFEDYDDVRAHYVSQWKNWQTTLLKLDEPLAAERSVSRVHRSACAPMSPKIFSAALSPVSRFPGASTKAMKISADIISSGRATWSKPPGALLAAGAVNDAARVLRYLEATQEADGNWAQNLWLDGRPYWSGIQMDETAFPILLVDLIRREAPAPWASSTAGGRWCARPPASSFATAR